MLISDFYILLFFIVGPVGPTGDFDFQSNLAQFSKGGDEEEEDDGGDTLDGGTGNYEKDDFFDSISCDALDKMQGVDNRLRGAHERSLNTETFGAVALNSQRRRRRGGGGGGRGRGRGHGRGGPGGRGRGRGSGRGRGRVGGDGGLGDGGGGSGPRENNRWKNDGQPQTAWKNDGQPQTASS
jgi:protein LSM14